MFCFLLPYAVTKYVSKKNENLSSSTYLSNLTLVAVFPEETQAIVEILCTPQMLSYLCKLF